MDKKKCAELSNIVKHLILVHGERMERRIKEDNPLGLMQEIDGFLISLVELRLSLVDLIEIPNDCGNPDCPIHGTDARAARATDPDLN